MTTDELKRRFPNGSPGFIRANASDSGKPAVRVGDTGKDAELERYFGNGALVQGQIQTAVAGRFLVRLTSVRQRLLDEDNLCEKYHVDCCRYAGVLPKDSPGTAKIETRQEKAEPKGREFVRIQIFKV